MKLFNTAFKQLTTGYTRVVRQSTPGLRLALKPRPRTTVPVRSAVSAPLLLQAANTGSQRKTKESHLVLLAAALTTLGLAINQASCEDEPDTNRKPEKEIDNQLLEQEKRRSYNNELDNVLSEFNLKTDFWTFPLYVMLRLPYDKYGQYKDLHGSLRQAFAALRDAGASLKQNDHFLYQAAIDNFDKGPLFSAGLKQLAALGLTVKEHPTIVCYAMRQFDKLEQFPYLTNALRLAGASPDIDTHLYGVAFSNVKNASYFEEAFQVLEKAGASIEKNPELYSRAVFFAENHAFFKSAFSLLEKLGATVDEGEELYLETMLYSSNKYTETLVAVSKTGADINLHRYIYQSALYQSCDGRYLTKAINKLLEAGASFDEHTSLFETALWYAEYSDSFSRVFKTLSDIGASIDKHSDVYEYYIKHTVDFDKVRNSLLALYVAGASIDEHKDLYLSAIDFRLCRSDSSIFINRVQYLVSKGFRADECPDVYKSAIVCDEPCFLQALDKAGIPMQENDPISEQNEDIHLQLPMFS